MQKGGEGERAEGGQATEGGGGGEAEALVEESREKVCALPSATLPFPPYQGSLDALVIPFPPTPPS